MKNLPLFLLATILMVVSSLYAQKPKKQMYMPDDPVPVKYKVDTRIDNMAYWRRMASLGLVPVEPDHAAPFGKYTGSRLSGRSVMTDDSPDVPVTTVNSTQSENSIFADPNNPQSVLNSNNSTPRPASTVYGANDFWSSDAGSTWGGHVQGAGGENSGDPTTAIGLNGWYYVGYIHSSGGQGVSYSTDQGNTWTPVLVAPAPSGFSSLLDKNHMWIDNSTTSPYEGQLYDAWTNFGGSNDSEIELSRSTDQGLSWSSPVNISSAINAGSHNQGVNIHTGPNGEVYAIWAIYDSWPIDENSIGMARSFDGGATWQPATRIISNIRGIRNTATSKNMRVNAFPSMAVDISNGPNRGMIYVVWPNIGVPGTNTGSDMDVYMIRSADQGNSWSTPVRVNQDPSGLGKQHYFPWITCDPANGNLSVIYYDDRNVSGSQAEVYVSNSIDGGNSWEDLKVSDVSFTPQPISGLASGYFGDYLGIHAQSRWVYPVWTDNRTGYAMTYVSAFQSGPPPNQPWVIYQTHLLNDAAGNNNGLLDYAENALLNVTLENIGDQPAAAVNAVISTESAFITFTDNTENFGDFAVGEVKTISDAFAFTVLPAVPDGEKITFTLSVTDANDSTFVSNFNIEAHAPGIQAGNLSINDASGNINGRLDPGETATLSIITFNPGDYPAEEVMAQLTTASAYATITNTQVELGNINPGMMNAVAAEFEISVSPEAPVGHQVALNYTANSLYHSTLKNFFTPVGLILEDWETGGFESFDWEFAGSAPWTIATDQVYEGETSAKSGAINDNASSEMKIGYNVMNPDTISFYLKVSSEADYDYLKFYVNNTLRGQWAGEVPWQQVKFAVNPGQQTFRWVYSKDVYVTGGSDCAWVDYIVFPAPMQTTAYAGQDASTCEQGPVMLDGTATNYTSVLWTTAGDGTFEDANQLNTFYTPGTQDLINGNVVLTLTVNGPEGEVRTDDMLLNISTPASVQTAETLSACAGTGVDIEALAENYTSIMWSTTGDGTFSDPASLNTTYVPGSLDISAGSATITLTAFSAAPCADATGVITLSILPAPEAVISGDTTICAGSELQIEVQLTGTAPWQLEIGDYGTFTAEQSPAYITIAPDTTQIVQVIAVTDANQCQGTGSGTYNITVNELPYLYLPADTMACVNHLVTLTAVTSGNVQYLWTPGGYITQSIIVDTTGIGAGTGTWTARITDENGCVNEASVNLTFNECTGLVEVEFSSFSVFPNPSDGRFSIQVSQENAGIYHLEITDASNKTVFSKPDVLIGSHEKQVFDSGILNNGIYLVKLSNREKTLSAKLIVKR
ncbi:protein containing Por secretion system C-terminal sorting domain [Lentimicrobium saccharophilum]|uniref:Protein containing Por secretion system C-terminal sorting domain n=1 Tax=Lentimicrobium saccharophilum TaxID=1678841 RepID=A0A0S7BP05_9BACT|nr:T9SS type A sorting domain-containing protein [Lentimicrobium saccharophilum]GAP42202.1 protein containing Por secretion system C-terminal sorting domain [Lentimicrobium saccharophilum]